MSTENTPTDVIPSGDTTESSAANTVSTEAEVTNAPVKNYDELKKAAKDSETSGFKTKSVAEGIEEAKGKKADAQPVVNAYTPNFKYKAALQEKEIEEFWRPLIKDADSEKRVKELLTRVEGFDFVKQSRDKLEQQMTSLSNDYHAQAEVVNRVQSALQSGDLNSVFRQLGVKKEDIFRWTQSELQRMEMPPEQRKAFEDAEELRQQQMQMKEQMTQYQKMYEQQAVQARTMQLDFVLQKPDVIQTAQSWDNLQGTPGAFRDLVIQEAQAAHFRDGTDLTAEQAVQLVMQKFGKVMSMGGTTQAPQMPVTPSQTPQATMPAAKPVIPNVNGKGSAPIQRQPKSIEDLKRWGKELSSMESQ